MKKFVLMVVALMGLTAANAQDVVAVYNEASKAVEAKNYAKAAELYESVIIDGSEEESDAALQCVANAKANLPVMYQRMGTSAASAAMKATDVKVKDAKFAEAIANLEKAIAKAKSFRNTRTATSAANALGKVYQVQGGTYFNAGDYAKAAEIFAKGYAADNKNTAMAMNLAESYFKQDKYAEGMKVCSEVAALPAGQKYDAAIAEAKAKMAQYTNNKVAAMQQANDFDGIIAMAATIADQALAQRVLVQAYFAKKDYDKVIELGEAAAALQTDDEGKSAIYFNLGSAYNAKEQKAKAVETLKKVTAEPYATPAKAAVAELSK